MTDRSEQLDAVIARYLQLVESGDAPNVEAFLAEHSDMEEELRSFITGYAEMQALAGNPPADPARSEPTVISRTPEQDPTVVRHLTGSTDTDPHLTETFVGSGPQSSASVDADGDALPRVFGDYELTNMIAHGGMGVVYKARQISLGRTVAVKMILSQHLAGEEHIQRFYREAKAAGALDHPGIVPVYEVGSHDGQHFFSMGFVDGGDLKGELKNGPLEDRIAAKHAVDVAEAVSYAHEKGIIHRDLKPGNVLIDQDGKLRLTDFGLATLSDGADAMTTSGQILGTPSYMPPEQALGEVENVGPLADVYSIGSVLYCLLTGRPPFQAANPLETLRQVIETEPVPLRQLNPAVSVDLETICLKCLEKEPSRRYASATDLAADLQRFLDNKPIEARPVGTLERASKWVRRNKTISVFAAAAVIALLAGTITSTIFGIQASKRAVAETRAKEDFRKKQEEATKLAGEKTELAKQQAQTIEELEDNLYVSRLKEAQAALDAGDYETAQRLLEVDLPKDRVADRRCFVWRYLHRLLRRADPSVIVRPASEEHSRLVRNESGTRVIVLSRSNFQVIDTTTMKVLFHEDGMDYSDGCFIDDDRIAIALGSGGAGTFVRGGKPRNNASRSNRDRYRHQGIKLYDVNVGFIERIRLPKSAAAKDGSNEAGVCVAASPDGRTLAFGLCDGRTGLWDLEERKLLKPLVPINYEPGETNDVIRVAFYRDGKTLIVLRYGYGLTLWDVGTQTDIETSYYEGRRGYRDQDFPTWLTDRSDIAVSDDGKIFAWSGNVGDLRAVEILDDDFRVIQFRPTDYAIASLDFIPGTHKLLTGGLDHTIRLWDADTGSQLEQVGSHRARVGGVAALPSGQVLSFGADNRIRRWNIPTDEARDSLQYGSRIYSVRFQPTSDRILASGWHSVTPAETGNPNGRRTSYGAGYFDLQSGKFEALQTYDNRYTRVYHLDVVPSGDLVAAGTTETRAVELWDRNLDLLSKIQLQTAPGMVSLHPSGRFVATRVGQRTLIHDTTSRELVANVPGESRFTPDGRYLVSGASTLGFRRIEPTGLGKVETTDLPGVVPLRFSADSRLLVGRLKSEPSAFLVIDIASRNILCEGRAHYGMVSDGAFCADGTTLVTVGKDKRAIFWDLRTGRPKAESREHTAEINTVDFSPDGTMLATGGNDSAIRLWRAPSVAASVPELTVTRLGVEPTDITHTAADVSATTFSNSEILDLSDRENVSPYLLSKPARSLAKFTPLGLSVHSQHRTAIRIGTAISDDFDVTVTLERIQLDKRSPQNSNVEIELNFDNEAKEAFVVAITPQPEVRWGQNYIPVGSTQRQQPRRGTPIARIEGEHFIRLIRKGRVIYFLYRARAMREFQVLGTSRLLRPDTTLANISLCTNGWSGGIAPDVLWREVSVKWNGDSRALSPVFVAKAKLTKSLDQHDAALAKLGELRVPKNEAINLSDRELLEERGIQNLENPSFTVTSDGLLMAPKNDGDGFSRVVLPNAAFGDFDLTIDMKQLMLPSPGSWGTNVMVGVVGHDGSVVSCACKRAPAEFADDGPFKVDCFYVGPDTKNERTQFGGVWMPELGNESRLRVARIARQIYFLARSSESKPWNLCATTTVDKSWRLSGIQLGVNATPKAPVVEWSNLKIRWSDRRGPDVDLPNSDAIDLTKREDLEARSVSGLDSEALSFTETGLVMKNGGDLERLSIPFELQGDFDAIVTLSELKLPADGTHGDLIRFQTDFNNADVNEVCMDAKPVPGENINRVIGWRTGDSWRQHLELKGATFPSGTQFRLSRRGGDVYCLVRPNTVSDWKQLGKKVVGATAQLKAIGLGIQSDSKSPSPEVQWQKLEIRWTQPSTKPPLKVVTLEELNAREFPIEDVIDLTDPGSLESRDVSNLDDEAWGFTDTGFRLDQGEKEGFKLLLIPKEITGDFDLTGTLNRFQLPPDGAHDDFIRFSVGFHNDDVAIMDWKKNGNPTSRIVCGRFAKSGRIFSDSDPIKDVQRGAQVRLSRRGDAIHYLVRPNKDAPWQHICQKDISEQAKLKTIGLGIRSGPDTASPVVEWKTLELRSD